MNLRKAAARFETTTFDVYDESTRTWSAGTQTGKISPIDRFLSNFNRPTKRRRLGVPPTFVFPDSKTIRVPATGEIYFVGEIRTDSRHGYSYDTMAVAHRSEATCLINRKSPSGPPTNPGHLVSAEVGHHYVDVELRSVSEIEETSDQFEGNYFILLPEHANIQEWDHVTIGSDVYHVKTAYLDSGFKFAQAIKRADQRKDFTYHFKGAGSDYDAATGVVTSGFVDYDVTGFSMNHLMGSQDYTAVKDSKLSIMVRQEHIGIVPSTNDKLTWQGVKYNVMSVQQDFLQKEYRLDCTL